MKRADAEGRWKRAEGEGSGQQCVRVGGGVSGSIDASRDEVLGDSDRSVELDHEQPLEQQHHQVEAHERVMKDRKDTSRQQRGR